MPTKPTFKTPLPILRRIEQCRLKQEKRLDLRGGTQFGQFLLPIIPPEVFSLTHLESLDLSHNAIQVVPEEIRQLPHLKHLDLRYNPLRQVADVFGLIVHYADFQTLKLSPAHIVGLKLTLFSYDTPAGIFGFPHLTTLEISRHRLGQIPAWVSKLENLTSLDVSRNELTSLEGLAPLVNLASLNVSSNNLTSLEGLAPLVNLASLNVSGNQLTSLKGLAPLVNLSDLNVSDNRLTSLEGLAPLVNLAYLNVSLNPLANLEGLARLVNLASLNVSLSPLASLAGLAPLVNLASLDVSYNLFMSLEGLAPLVNLTFLNVSHNRLMSLEGLAPLVNLASLNVSHNQLTSLEGLAPLVNLAYLSVWNNQLTSLEGLAPLVNLASLNVSLNPLANLEGLARLVNLTSLKVNHNQLTSLPEALFALPKLEDLQVDENSITDPPIEQLALDRGQVHLLRVRNYLRQLAEEKDYLYEAKLLIVGEGGAGKTSLARKIDNPQYPITPNGIDSTEGIDILRWAFPFNTDHAYRVNIWDFGGQEIYHATHQFFLTKRALYVLVADNRREDTDFYYWLSVVELLGGNSPVLIVKNEKDDRTRDIDEKALRGQFLNLKEVYATNLRTHSKDFPKLSPGLQYQLRNLPHIGTALPKRWLEVRKALEADTRYYISLEDFFSLCEQQGFKHEGDKLQLSRTLHELGSILHFQDDRLLKKTIFLKPHWATEAVYHVLDNKTVQGNLGKFTTTDLKQIWHEPAYQFMDGELLQLMLNFKLCYPLTYCPDTYIAPQLLTVNQPSYNWQSQDNLVVFCKYPEFMPKGIITQLIVALHKDIADKQHLVWRSGVVLDRDRTRAQVIEDYGKRELKISVEGQNKRDMMTVIMHELDKIHDSYHKQLKYEVLLPCSCTDPNFFEYGKLKEFVAIRRPIQCQKTTCLKMLDARDLIDGVLNVRELEREAAGDTYHIYSPNDVTIIHTEETHSTMTEKNPIRSSWANGSFYLATITIITGVFGYFAKDIPLYMLIVIVIGSILGTLLVGILQLRQDEQLKEKSFIELAKLIVNQLPLFGSILKIGKQSKDKKIDKKI